jgi:tetrapyrrole methylase family protein / MazG family protein
MAYSEITDPFRRFVRIMERLQEPGGCPWDREQTHESLKQYLIEETYEAVDAIDRGHLADLEEELGDVLLQVVFHAVLASRSGNFGIDDVLETASAKMVHRHPHVFGDAEAHTAADVLHNWEKLKEKEREAKGEGDQPSSLLSGIPGNLPALLQAQRMQEKAGRVGFDFENRQQVLQKVHEEIDEFAEALDSGDAEHAAREFGDIIFSLVNLARFLKIDAEDALRQTSAKFRRRFEQVEERARALGRPLREMTLGEMDDIWNEVKRGET